MRNALRLFAAAFAAASIAACGGGGTGETTTTRTAADATVVAGTVTGLGQFAVDGVTYDASAAAVAFDVDPRAETAASVADLKLGQQVEVQLADGKAAKVLVRASLIGAVEAIDAAGGSFQAVGQTVRVTPATLFEGASGLAALQVGDRVEVHGTLDAAGNLVATRVEVKPADGVVRVRAAGIVTRHDGAAKTFKLGALTIDYAAAVIKPEGATIDDGALVFVFSDRLPSDGTLVARAVRVVSKPVLEGRHVVIGGLVTDASADGKTFKVNGIAVDASDAQLLGPGAPTFADIANMARVRVEGTLTGSGGSLVLKATRVWIVPAAESRRVILLGQVTDFVSTASFKVRGTPVDGSGAVLRNGSEADLRDGAFVLVKGHVAGDTVRADEIVFLTPPPGQVFRLFGVVRDYDAAAGTFRLLAIPMRFAPDATFEGGTRAEFGDGDLVEVTGSFDGAVFVVTHVKLRFVPAPLAIVVSGTVADLTPAGFKLNGVDVLIDAGTQIVGGPLANGQFVEVTARCAPVTGALPSCPLLAIRIEVFAAATARLYGPITDFVSAADFTRIFHEGRGNCADACGMRIARDGRSQGQQALARS
jgi:hypothetical protein